MALARAVALAVAQKQPLVRLAAGVSTCVCAGKRAFCCDTQNALLFENHCYCPTNLDKKEKIAFVPS